LADQSDLLLVVGSRNSSNSVRLVEVGLRGGAAKGHLLDDASGLDWAWLEGVRTVGVTAGASAPEVLVQGLIDKLATRFEITIEDVAPTRETVTFKLPKLLTS
jgi:4-hydroxy-3-methylbut-2-enyl diphosphate reductase